MILKFSFWYLKTMTLLISSLQRFVRSILGMLKFTLKFTFGIFQIRLFQNKTLYIKRLKIKIS